MGNFEVGAMRGRYDKQGTTEQRLEISKNDQSNAITTVQKDNLLLSHTRIRKLTPRECWRLMGFSDLDFFSAMIGDRDKATQILHDSDMIDDKIVMERFEPYRIVSNSQLYKQAGNSIVVDVLEHIFAKMFDIDIQEKISRERERERERRNITHNNGKRLQRSDKGVCRIVCEQRKDEGLRFFKDDVCGALRTKDSCGDKRVLEME